MLLTLLYPAQEDPVLLFWACCALTWVQFPSFGKWIPLPLQHHKGFGQKLSRIGGGRTGSVRSQDQKYVTTPALRDGDDAGSYAVHAFQRGPRRERDNFLVCESSVHIIAKPFCLN